MQTIIVQYRDMTVSYMSSMHYIIY